MSSTSSLPRWRPTPSEPPLSPHDQPRMSSLNVRAKLRTHSQPEHREPAQDDWHTAHLGPTPSAPLAPASLTDQQYFEREAFLTAPSPVKQSYNSDAFFKTSQKEFDSDAFLAAFQASHKKFDSDAFLAAFRTPQQKFEQERASPRSQPSNPGFPVESGAHIFNASNYKLENTASDYAPYNPGSRPTAFTDPFQPAPGSSADDLAAQPTAKELIDHKYFVSNMPTMHLGFNSSPGATSDLHALTTQETVRHAAARLFTAELAAAKLPGAQHALGQQTLAALKRVRYKNVSLVGASLVALILVVLFAQSSLSHQTLSALKTNSVASAPQLASNLNNKSQQQRSPANTPTPTSSVASGGNDTQASTPFNASQALVRLSQLDRNQYASQSEYDTWAYSACSTTSMTEVFNAYGRNYHVTDVLKVESAIGEITPQQGLLENIGVARTAAKFGFKTDWGSDWTLSQVLDNANAGRPVIVGWPPYKYTDGHIVVVTGGDANNVYLADSSIYNRRAITRAQFMQWWAGFAAVVTPA